MADRTPTTSVLSTPRRSLIGQRFGMLVVAELVDDRSPGAQRGHRNWRCICDCGGERMTTTGRLTSGWPACCGCRYTRKLHGHTSVHGKDHPLYVVWRKMRERCYNPRHDKFRFYGARGITVCDQWRHDFAAFLADVGDRPTPEHSLDRIDGSKGYEPGNCRWATQTEQTRNTRRTHFVEFQGRTMSLAEAVEISGLPYRTVNARIKRLGWSTERALSVPI